MCIWWAAGFVTAAVRIVDDGVDGLPMETRDTGTSFFEEVVRSPKLHAGLSIGHTLSCVGLFVSIILLCIAMGLMKGEDSPGHAYLWQNAVYLLSAVAYMAAVAACGRSPPKIRDAALPPEAGEFATCLALDVAAAVALVVCFPHL
ncbi:unnamed protein product, partial [Prorocentrum cordatum]